MLNSVDASARARWTVITETIHNVLCKNINYASAPAPKRDWREVIFAQGNSTNKNSHESDRHKKTIENLKSKHVKRQRAVLDVTLNKRYFSHWIKLQFLLT